MSFEDEHPIRIVFLGDTQVGKTSIIATYATGECPDQPASTITGAFQAKSVKLSGKTYDLQLWDTAGQELYRTITPMYYRNASIAIIVFSVTEPASFDSVHYWTDEVKENGDRKTLIAICGNKIDLEEARAVPFPSASAFAKEIGALYVETSAKTHAGVDKLFEVCLSRYLQCQAEVSPSQQTSIPLTVPLEGPKGDEKKKNKNRCC
jgi:Rab family protein